MRKAAKALKLTHTITHVRCIQYGGGPMVPDDVLVFPCRRTVMTFMSSPQPTFHSSRSRRSMALSTGLLLNKKT